ncbi:MAG: hypothetical protein ACRDK0_10090 [Solirubrobacteraceae bacterium]
MSWGVVYYKASDGRVPAEDFLDSCPAKVEARILAVLEAVRAAPPPQFSGGGKWEAMHGDMGGYYEIRVTGPGRTHYRLFCMLDNGSDDEPAERGFNQPQIVVVNGMFKAHRTEFSDREYRKNVRDLGDRYRASLPRRIANRDDRKDARDAIQRRNPP